MVHGDGQTSEAELAAFADGSVPPRRRAQVAARIERSCELRALVGEQRAALHAVRALEAPAPARLRARIRHDLSRPPSRPRARLRPVPLAIAAGIAGLVVVVLPLQDRRTAPTVLEVARLARRSPTAPAPPTDRAERSLRDAALAGCDSQTTLHSSAGTRSVPASTSSTAEKRGRSSTPAAGGRPPTRASPATRSHGPQTHGTRFATGPNCGTLGVGGQTIVSWLRTGDTCVLSGAGLTRDELLALAAWSESMGIASVYTGLFRRVAPTVHRSAP